MESRGRGKVPHREQASGDSGAGGEGGCLDEFSLPDVAESRTSARVAAPALRNEGAGGSFHEGSDTCVWAPLFVCGTPAVLGYHRFSHGFTEIQ